GDRRPLIEQLRIARVEQGLVATALRWAVLGRLSSATTAESLGDEPSSVNDRIHRRQQFPPRIGLADVASRTGAECGFGDVPRPMLAHEEDSEIRIVCEDSAGCFDAVQRREANVEQNQIRSESDGFLNGIWSIGGL